MFFYKNILYKGCFIDGYYKVINNNKKFEISIYSVKNVELRRYCADCQKVFISKDSHG